MVLPRSLQPAERRMVEQAVERITHLGMGKAGVWTVSGTGAEETLEDLRPETWREDSHHWASVAPVFLDRYPDAPLGEQAEASIRESCERSVSPIRTT